MEPLVQLIFAVALIIFFRSWFRKERLRLPLPPGPPAEPLIGHLRLIPAENQEDIFYEWGKHYGDVIHIHFPGRSIVVLNSVKAANDLLGKRSRIYSDRPRFPVYELMGWINSSTFIRYGEAFRRHRRMLQQSLNAQICVSYHAAQTREARNLLQSLLSSPKDREDHISRFSTAIIVEITYGYQLASDGDTFLKLAQESSEVLHQAGSPGGTLVDSFPFLEYLPSWFPGTHYANMARRGRGAIDAIHRFPFEYVLGQMANKTAKPSFVKSRLEEREVLGSKYSNSNDDIISVGASMYAAGAGTTWSTISTFIYAMLLFPKCQARAQKEIDSVIGGDRLPDFDDRKALPYVDAVMRETMRWHGVAPLGVPHRCMEDDIYRGMLIPKGSTVISNIRAMSLDEEIYSDPHTFNPARFLPRPEGNEEPHPDENLVFGFGRRICPGRHLADGSVWIALASILATFNISRAVKEDGTEIIPDTSLPFKAGLASHPPVLPCNILPRNEKARSLIVEAKVLSPA